MKRKITIIIFVFFCANYHYSQTKQDSILAYNQIKNWAVTQLTIAYIEDLKDWNVEDEVKTFQNKEEEQEWETYKNLKSKYFKYSSDVNLNEVSNALTRGWLKTRDSVFSKYKSELVDSAKKIDFKTISFIPKISKTNKKLTRINRKNTIKEIEEQYRSALFKILKASEDKKDRTLNSRVNENSSKTNKFSMVMYGIFGLSLLLNIFFITKLSKNKRKRDQLKISKLQRNNHYWEKENQKSRQEISNLKIQNEKLALQIKELRENNFTPLRNDQSIKKEEIIPKVIKQNLTIENDQNDQKVVKGHDIIEDEKPMIINLDVQNSSTKTIYLPAPFEDCRFASEDVSENVKAVTLYEAEINKETNEGVITILQTANLSRALNSPNIYLETACDYENAHNPEVTSVEVVEKGVVILENDDWIVKKKIRIKFN